MGYDLLCNRDAAGARDVRTHVRIVALVVEKKRRGGSEVLRQVGWFDTCLEKLFCQGGGGVREPFELNDVVEGGGIGACGPLDRGGARSSRGGGVAVKDFKICFPDVALGL